MGAAAYPVGSSPLARGLLRGGGFPGHPRGIIPARAGFTSRLRAHPPGDQDHPRSRGVYVWGLESDAAAAGSSPLARGLLQGGCRRAACHRIIPARAGFTLLVPLYTPAGGDHPRSRGVYGGAAASAIMGGGSSPLARGLRRQAPPGRQGHGIIPARAGFTVVHVRGSEARPGSSPLARGLRGSDNIRPVGRGIIPARAGFTASSQTGTSGLRDHPRSRGVYVPVHGAVEVQQGSSPLARGLQPELRDAVRRLRIIPARAGFTAPPPSRAPTGRDHPRSRGVYTEVMPSKLMTPGSSPLARGLLDRVGAFLGACGIIPARAGFTRRADHEAASL